LPGGQFGKPVALTEPEIVDLVERFGICAKACQEAGFTGVQIHSAHGYLLSQFLSPRTNLRDDRYGGSLENRARMLVEVVAAIRTAVGPNFPIAVKLNSADFQKGGFEFADSIQVAKWLEAASVDMIEISGGTYEQPQLLGVEGMEEVVEQEVQESTVAREAYFVDFALAMQQEVSIPLMVTGGFRLKSAMEEALQNGADVIGIGRPMCVMTDAPDQLMSGLEELPRYESQLTFFPPWLEFLNRFKALRALSTFGVQYWFYAQLELLGQTGTTEPNMSTMAASKRIMTQQKEWLNQR
jgi:2,4-dienoyl-CoA reductase-like NADH-dependent reductase (Old Yellow Enzyme family)